MKSTKSRDPKTTSSPKCKKSRVAHDTKKQGLSSGPKLKRTMFRTSREMDFFSEKELVTQTGNIDASTKRGGRPRYLIDEDDVAAFERSRSTVASPPATSSKRRRKNVPQYV